MLNTITKEKLEKLYVQEEKTMKECSEILNISVGSIYNYIKKYNIKSRIAMTEKTRQKISDALIGRPSSRKGYKLSESTKRKISEANKGKFYKSSKYGGHRKQRTDGYICVYLTPHQRSTKDGYVMEHILVMEEKIGRYITRDEVVHHKNHIRNDNRLENLELMTFREHMKMHSKERWEKYRKEKKNNE